MWEQCERYKRWNNCWRVVPATMNIKRSVLSLSRQRKDVCPVLFRQLGPPSGYFNLSNNILPFALLCFLLLLTHRVTYIQNNPRACKIRERMFIECSSASSVPPPGYFNLSSTSPPIFYTLKLLLKVTVGSVVKCVLEPYIGRVRQAKGGRQA